ncbi:unnamed protein product [Cochlearia groenlandica]
MAPKSTPRLFANIENDFCRQPLTVKVLHTWEVRSFRRGNTLMVLEMLLIDRSVSHLTGYFSYFTDS